MLGDVGGDPAGLLARSEKSVYYIVDTRPNGLIALIFAS
jgi:hypothetical protein